MLDGLKMKIVGVTLLNMNTLLITAAAAFTALLGVGVWLVLIILWMRDKDRK